MSDSLMFDGEEFISSRRASKETGYTQDYIGQLARGGAIVGKRIGGHWYISQNSLRVYKLKADEYKPTPPSFAPVQPDSESAISFEGKDFISASAAAKQTGYHQDYIGQLARSGKISSRQISNRWFVDRDALIKHKLEKDSLVAAVQSEYTPPTSKSEKNDPEKYTHDSEEREAQKRIPTYNTEPFFSYTQQGSDLMPVVPQKSVRAQYEFAQSQYSDGVSFSHSTDSSTPLLIRRSSQQYSLPLMRRHIAVRKKKRSRLLVPVAGAALTIVIVLTFGFTSLKDKALYALGEIRSQDMGQNAAVGSASAFIAGVIEKIEEIFSHEIRYTAERK